MHPVSQHPTTPVFQAARQVASYPLRTHFVPWWPKNPYHEQLARALAAENVSVVPLRDLRQLPRPSRTASGSPDILHLHALPPFASSPRRLAGYTRFWWRLLRLRQSGAKLVFTVHNIAHHEATHPQIDLLFSRWLYLMADAVIVHSPAALKAVEKSWHVHRKHNVFVIQHGHFIHCYPPPSPADKARAALNLPSRGLTVLFLGSIRPYKGVLPLIEAFRSLHLPDAQLVIVGETLSSELNSQITQAAAGDATITFRPGYVSSEEISLYLSASDVVVFPYTRALTSGALILAMSLGRACIAPLTGALSDTLHADGGFLYLPEDPTGLRKALLSASQLRGELPSLGHNNYSRAQAWTWESVASKTRQAYEACFR